jgi:hypothetical protein
MTMQDDFYTNKLYPLQDEVLQTLAPVNSIFYLTGGTALSRHYLHHRYSDDLDFFTNSNPAFQQQAQLAIETLKEKFEVHTQTLQPSFALLFVVTKGVELKLDFVNDVPFRVDSPIESSLFPRTDHWKNILSNKITALQRDAPKDIADLIFLCKKFSFHWPEIIEQASMKDMWVNELDVTRYIAEYNIESLSAVKWIITQDKIDWASSLKQIAKDILLGTENSLFNK